MGTNGQDGRRYRSWPEALKREIVAASFAPGASVSVVARHYDVNANQLFSWRKRYRAGLPTPGDSAPTQLMPVMITAEDVPCVANGVDGTIEIDLTGQYRVRVGNGFDGDALRRVLDVLERR
jgi:transposase